MLADEIAKGVESVERCEAIIRTVAKVSTNITGTAAEIPNQGDAYVSLNDLKECAGLALGSPTRFGNMSAAMKYFLDGTSTLWLSGHLVDKPATVFTSTSSLHGGQESTLLTMMIPLLHHGMIISGVPYSDTAIANTQTGGSPYGATHWSKNNSVSELSMDEKQICQAQGRRLALLCLKLSQN